MQDNSTALMLACHYKDGEIVEILLAHGADTNIQSEVHIHDSHFQGVYSQSP